jgi:hypothetical protein
MKSEILAVSVGIATRMKRAAPVVLIVLMLREGSRCDRDGRIIGSRLSGPDELSRGRISRSDMLWAARMMPGFT